MIDRLLLKLVSAKGTASTRLLIMLTLIFLAWRITEVEKDVAIIKYRIGLPHQMATK